MIKVLLVDDHTLFVESLRDLIERHAEDIEVVAIASSGEEACKRAHELHPDVILMDIRMPGMDGITAAEEICTADPGTHVIFLTTFSDERYVRAALQGRFAGYLLKDINTEELLTSIRSAVAGLVLVSPGISSQLARNFPPNTATATAPPLTGDLDVEEMLDTLSHREVEILKQLVLGYSNKEIAQRLNAAEQTVKNHVSLIYDKIGLHNRFQLMRLLRGRL